MTARIKRAPMPAFEGFLLGVFLLGVVACLVGHKWGDAIDGALLASFFVFWSSERRRADALQAHLNVVRRSA